MDDKIIVTIDPGHGGDEDGTTRNRYFFDDNTIIKEKDLTLYIAIQIYNYLQNNSDIETHLTRIDNSKMSLSDRGLVAGNYKSDLMVSVHFNNAGKLENSAKAMGTEIWQSVVDTYKPIGLPESIFKELNKNHFLQVVRGTRERVSSDSYWDYNLNESTSFNTGFPADYYGVIKAGCRNHVPTIILEQSFLSNDNDFANILDISYLDELAERIAKGIINYYNDDKD